MVKTLKNNKSVTIKFLKYCLAANVLHSNEKQKQNQNSKFVFVSMSNASVHISLLSRMSFVLIVFNIVTGSTHVSRPLPSIGRSLYMYKAIEDKDISTRKTLPQQNKSTKLDGW